MKISVIFTGGTIGSVTASDGTISPSGSGVAELTDFFDKMKSTHEFRFFSPVNVLSECITLEQINKIILCVRAAQKGSDAVIITHGTDSLAYSAAALSYCLAGIEIPVVLVSSGYVLRDPRANGLLNLADALSFCADAPGGVFAVWNGRIHRGTRLCPPRAYTDKVESICAQYFADISGGRIVKNPNHSALPDEVRAQPLLDTSRRVLMLSPAPAFDYSLINADCDAVLLTSYHSGTIDTKSRSFADFCRRAKDNGAEIYLHGSYTHADYESKSAFAALGIEPLPVMSQCAAYMKLFALSPSDVKKSLSSDIIPNLCEGEVTV